MLTMFFDTHLVEKPLTKNTVGRKRFGVKDFVAGLTSIGSRNCSRVLLLYIFSGIIKGLDLKLFSLCNVFKPLQNYII